jgi:hypothetical protein
MYLSLMRQSQNAAAMDSGLTMIAAGLTPHAATRAALIGASGSSSGRGGITGADIVNMQKAQTEAQLRQVRQAAKAGLMKQYGLDAATVDYLDANNKLDEVLANRNQMQVIEDNKDGSKHVYTNDGRHIATVGSAKPEEGQFVDGPNGPVLMSKRGSGAMAPPVGAKPEEGQFVDGPNGPVLMSKRGTGPMDKPVGKKLETQVVKNDATGEQKLVNKDTGETIQQITPPRQPGDAVHPDDDALFKINTERNAAGQPVMSMEEFIKLKKPSGVNVHVSPNGLKFGAPPAGHSYKVNDKGEVLTDENGTPTLIKIPGGKPADDAAAKATEAAAEADKLATAKGKEAVQTAFKTSNFGRATRTALDYMDKPGATGAFSTLSRGLPLGGALAPWKTLDAATKTLDAVNAFDALKQMRDASPTGASGLGQVTDVEQQMLKSAIGNLSPHQDPKILRQNLIRADVALHLLAENDFNAKADPAGAPARFNAALAKAIQEREAEEFSRRNIGSRVKITPVVK